MRPCALGVDIGGTKIQFAFVEEDGTVLYDRKIPTEAEKGGAQVLAKVLEGIGDMLRRSDRPVSGIGIGTAGQVDFETGTVVFAVDTLPGWTGTPLKAAVSETFGLPVWVDNDVNVLALAEARYGKPRYGQFICLALGTGIGGAIYESGRILRGTSGCAGEFGHMSVHYQGPVCSCGNRGCLELYASGSGIARLAQERIRERGWKVSWEPNAESVIAAWQAQDPYASEIVEEALQALGTAVAGLVHAFNPEAVLFGGGMANAGALFFQRLAQICEQRTSPVMWKAVTLRPVSVGRHAGVIGAAAQVWHYR